MGLMAAEVCEGEEDHGRIWVIGIDNYGDCQFQYVKQQTDAPIVQRSLHTDSWAIGFCETLPVQLDRMISRHPREPKQPAKCWTRLLDPVSFRMCCRRHNDADWVAANALKGPRAVRGPLPGILTVHEQPLRRDRRCAVVAGAAGVGVWPKNSRSESIATVSRGVYILRQQ